MICDLIEALPEPTSNAAHRTRPVASRYAPDDNLLGAAHCPRSGPAFGLCGTNADVTFDDGQGS